MTPDIRDQHVADLRAALRRASRLLAYSAGGEAWEDPAHSAQVMAEVERIEGLLNRTTPE